MINPGLLAALGEFDDNWAPEELSTELHNSLANDELSDKMHTALHNLRALLHEVTDRLTAIQVLITDEE